MEIRAVEIAKAEETSSSSSRRAAKDTMQEQNQDEADGDIDQEISFELKWLVCSSNVPGDRTIKPLCSMQELRVGLPMTSI